MPTPRKTDDPDVPVPPETLECLRAFEEILELILKFTAPGSALYHCAHRTAANANGAGKRLLNQLRSLRHLAMSPPAANGNGRA